MFTTALLTGCASVEAFINIEEPAYTVIKKDGDFEVREYKSMVVAEAWVSGSIDQASSDGFRIIAGYIFGANIANTSAGSEKIAMTAPVTMAQEGQKIAMTAPVTMESTGDRWRMHFVMPAKYTLATLPTPKNPAVKLREVAGARMAVMKFSGFSGMEKVERNTTMLREWMAREKVEGSATAQLARYNPPITPPMFRRNEILIPLR